MVAGVFLSGLLASLWQGAGGAEESFGEYALLQVGLWAGLAGAVVLACRRKGSGSLARDFGWRFRSTDFAIGAGAGILSQILLPVVALALRPLVGEPEVSGPVRDLIDRSEGAAYIGLLLATVVGAPIVEELFFRGLVLRGLEKRLGTAWAIGLSSVAFGLSHLPDVEFDALVVVQVSLIVFGAVLALLTVRNGRLGPAIVAHATFNAITLSYLTLGN